MQDEVYEGTVAWFKNSYGFIRPDNGHEDVFCHQTAIRMKGHRTLREGQRVSYKVVAGDKGPQADEVIVLEV